MSQSGASDPQSTLPEPTPRIAFVSHTTPDDGYVAELESFLRASGFDQVFNDSRSIEPYEKFWPKIEEGIRACDAFYVVITSASMNSPWVLREVDFARGLSKKIVPLWIEDCTVPATFVDRDVIDFRPRTRKERRIASSRILRHSPKHLFGREEWLDALDAAWSARGRLHVYSLIALGGAGKTSVVAHWVARRMAAQCWNGVERYFDWSFYSQGTRETSQAGADFFIAAALEFFGDPDPKKGSPWDRGQRLAEFVRKHRTLLVLDGIEPLQFPPNSPQAGELKDEALTALLQGLAMDNPGLCIVTSREPLKNLETFHGSNAEEKHLNKLTKEAAISLLRHLQIAGTEEEMEAAWRDAGGHALTLQLLGRFLADAHGGDIRKRREVDLQTADRETPGRTAMKVMLAYETWLVGAGVDRQRDLAVLRLMGLFDRPVGGDRLAALRAAPVIEGLTEGIVGLEDWQWSKALKDLESLELISVSPESAIRGSTGLVAGNSQSEIQIDAHPLVREYFAAQLREKQPNAFRAAHGRLFDHLCEITDYRPDTLEGLQPLYEAVTHGCLAGRHEDARSNVYRDRILRGNDFYSAHKLGAVGADLGAIAAFFESPWRRLSPNLREAEQAWLLNEAAFRLQTLGRLTEAIEPMRVSGEMDVKVENWPGAAISYGNLSELEVTLGLLDEAEADGRRAIEFADRSKNEFKRMCTLCIAADALHQRGEFAEAHELFEEAERMQAEYQPMFRLLYTIRGFWYAELILASAEHEVWRIVVSSNPPLEISNGQSISACDKAVRRANKWLEWRMASDSLLTIALDDLMLARASLYNALLQPEASTTSALKEIAAQLGRALNNLRQAGTIHHVPKALLIASLFEAMKGEGGKAKAKDYLAEAQLIAERGPMPLYLADVHLHRARLFRDRDELAKARALIEKHGYWRRCEELADAEAAAVNW